MSRPLLPLPVPAGPALAAALPALQAALTGNGPALLPVPADDPDETAKLVSAFAAGEPLADGEDDLDDPTAFVLGTSGSTGTPKGALLAASALRHSVGATAGRLGTAAAHWLLTLPGHHIAGLQVLLRALTAGTEPVLMDTGKPFTAARFTAATGAMRSGPRCVSLVPTQLSRILDDAEASAAAATFDAVLLGGAAADPVLLDRARAAGIRAVTTYGMSETCGGCVYDGVPLDGITVGIEHGRITLTGPVIARGYRGRPGDRSLSGRTFRTNDLGELADGRLRVLGRADDVIVTGGLKLDPAPAEASLRSVPGVAEVLLVGVPDPQWGQVVVALVVPAGAGPALEDLVAAARRHGIAAVPRRLVLTSALPLRGIGKPDRRAAAELARQVVDRSWFDGPPPGRAG